MEEVDLHGALLALVREHGLEELAHELEPCPTMISRHKDVGVTQRMGIKPVGNREQSSCSSSCSSLQRRARPCAPLVASGGVVLNLMKIRWIVMSRKCVRSDTSPMLPQSRSAIQRRWHLA